MLTNAASFVVLSFVFPQKLSVDLFRQLQLKIHCYRFIVNNVLVAITVYSSAEGFSFFRTCFFFQEYQLK